jgi:multisubunit Na+/H+ antiporter MnhF subunit
VNAWLIAALALLPALLACGLACALLDTLSALAALELAGTLATAELMLLAEGTHRQPFVDLAVTAALMSVAGALAFVRLMERRL